jgi:hypothetical protein
MSNKDKRAGWIKIFILLTIVTALKIFSAFPTLIEKYYSSSVYLFIARILRIATGWLPFSVGDLLYTAAIIWMIIRLFKTSASVVKRKVTRESFGRSFQRTISIILWVYIVFYSLWGLNYNRLGIAYQLHLQPMSYSLNDLKTLTSSLISKVNDSRKKLDDSKEIYPSNRQIFSEAKEAYANAEKEYPFLHYSNSSVKGSLYGELGNYIGFLGYYNPFTGEAQVNTTVPPFVIPYTVCHEMGHQLGYGTEDEANFTGYLAARSSKENTFQYSVYFDLFAYANRTLFMADSLAAKQNYKLLDTLVKKDIAIYRKFLRDHQNPIEPYITMLYGKYLQANNQPKGMETYDDVVSWLIAYQKKYGDL